MLRLIRWTASALVVLLLAGWGIVWLGARNPDGAAGRLVHGVASAVGPVVRAGLRGRPEIGGPFTLVDQSGKTVTAASFRGRWMLVYFGYTYCPDVCPTELQAIAAAIDKLGPDGSQLVPVFVTVDPERDTPAALADYIKLFDDRIVGLTGTPEQIALITREYHVYYAKVVPKGSDTYLMDHSSFLYLMAPDGSFRSLIRPGDDADQIASAIEAQMHQPSRSGISSS
jgi:protein SCO1/2